MSTSNTVKEFLQRERARLETSSRQKNVLLAAMNYIDELEEKLNQHEKPAAFDIAPNPKYDATARIQFGEPAFIHITPKEPQLRLEAEFTKTAEKFSLYREDYSGDKSAQFLLATSDKLLALANLLPWTTFKTAIHRFILDAEVCAMEYLHHSQKSRANDLGEHMISYYKDLNLSRAKTGYLAYVQHAVKGTHLEGDNKIPTWDELPESVQQSWQAATEAILGHGGEDAYAHPPPHRQPDFPASVLAVLRPFLFLLSCVCRDDRRSYGWRFACRPKGSPVYCRRTQGNPPGGRRGRPE